VDLVKLQPNPRFFYKTFLELDASNMASILAFDSRAMECLLRDENSEYFSEEYPIIYKNKIRKKTGKDFYYISALDAALKNNQVKAVNKMIEYVVKYQNNYVSSYLFLKILPSLMQKDIKIQAILESEIFTVIFDFDEWPGNHNNDEECVRFYNESFYHLRHHYKTIYPEDEFSLE
jgi:hypothetical protein|tara:strand:+ start:745 stop:1272 length:528 start_codon:yes stop_codon:yes gene_type:complete